MNWGFCCVKVAGIYYDQCGTRIYVSLLSSFCQIMYPQCSSSVDGGLNIGFIFIKVANGTTFYWLFLA
jgi:hypothetical protein